MQMEAVFSLWKDSALVNNEKNVSSEKEKWRVVLNDLISRNGSRILQLNIIIVGRQSSIPSHIKISSECGGHEGSHDFSYLENAFHWSLFFFLLRQCLKNVLVSVINPNEHSAVIN